MAELDHRLDDKSIFEGPQDQPSDVSAPNTTCTSTSSTNRVSAPSDVIEKIGTILLSQNSLKTLSSLSLTSKSNYILLAPKIYSTLTIDGPYSSALFDINGLEEGGKSLKEIRGDMEGKSWDWFFDPENAAMRRVWLFGLVTNMIVARGMDEGVSKRFLKSVNLLNRSSRGDPPEDDGNTQLLKGSARNTSRNFTTTTNPTDDNDIDNDNLKLPAAIPTTQLLFPNLHTIHLCPLATDSIRTYSPEAYDVPHSPALFEALSLSSQPTILSLEFPTPQPGPGGYEQYVSDSSTGAYNFIARLSQLRKGLGWVEVRELRVGGIVGQVLPSFSGVKNIYTFIDPPSPASSIISTIPSSSSSSFPSNRSGSVDDGVYVSPYESDTSRNGETPNRVGKGNVNVVEGPHWSYRSWQIIGSIKNIFLPRERGDTALVNTTWTYRNISGHVLSLKRGSGCIDVESGVVLDDLSPVGEGMVSALIRDQIENSLARDLPIREGFGGDRAGEVKKRIAWV